MIKVLQSEVLELNSFPRTLASEFKAARHRPRYMILIVSSFNVSSLFDSIKNLRRKRQNITAAFAGKSTNHIMLLGRRPISLRLVIWWSPKNCQLKAATVVDCFALTVAI